jgi:hypothetical protein
VLERGRYTISVTPEVSPVEKKKPKRSAKPKSETSENPGNSTVDTHPALESAPVTNGATKPLAEWDRTGGREAIIAQREQDAIISRTPFPIPDSKTLPFPKFCEYWNALIQQPVSKYARIYVRRWFPGLLPEEIEDAQSGLSRESHPSEKKYTKDDGLLSEMRILSDIGVGDYTFRLNDTRRPWDQATIVHGEKLSTMRNWDLYPPVFDKKRLDWDDEANRVYIKWAQSRGHLPQDRDKEKEQADMAQANVVEIAMNDARLERARVDQLQKEATERAEREAKEAKDALAKAQAAKPEEPKVAAPASDLLSVVSSVATLAKSLQPPKDDSLSEYLKLQTEREKTEREKEREEREATRKANEAAAAAAATAAAAERKRADDLQAEVLADLKKKVDTPPPTPVALAVPPSRRQMLEDAVAEQELLKRLAGRGHTAEEEKPSNIDKWIEAAPLFAPIANSIIGGFFGLCQFGLQTWQQISYNNALAKNGGSTEPKPPTTMEKPPEPGKPIPPQPPAQTGEQIAQQQGLNLILAEVAKIISPLQRALNNSKTGDEFAEAMIDFTGDGRADYDKVRNVAETLTRLGFQVPGAPGVEQFKQAAGFLFQHFQDFYKKVVNLPTFGVFLEEFYDYDKIAAQKQQEGQ